MCKNLAEKGRQAWNKGLPGRAWTEESKKKVSLVWQERREKNPNVKFSGSKWSSTRKMALLRDNYTCQECGFREPEIMTVDHIKPKALFPELMYQLTNTKTLCPNCHAQKTKQDQNAAKLKLAAA
jgi:5-methylcytosine-specific restriction endonuclease McrA